MENRKNENARGFPVWSKNSEGGGDMTDVFQIVKAVDSKQMQNCCLLSHAMSELQGVQTVKRAI